MRRSFVEDHEEQTGAMAEASKLGTQVFPTTSNGRKRSSSSTKLAA